MITEAIEDFPWGRFLLILAVAALLRLTSLDLPLDRDEGEYATLAWSWMQGLGLPYRDFLEQKPPLAVLAYAAAFFLGGFKVSALRVFVLGWSLATCAALFVLLWRITRRANAALIATALYACLSVSIHTQGLAANTELFVTLPMIGAVAVLLQGRDKKNWILAGICVGIAGLAKQSALPAAVLLPLLLAEGWPQRLRASMASVLGAGLPWLLCLIAFGLAGSAGDFWRCVVSYNFEYADQGGRLLFGNLLSACLSLAREDLSLWLAAAFAAFAAWKGDLEDSSVFWAWLLAMFMGAMMGGRCYPHYFQTLAAPLSAILGLWVSGERRRWLSVTLLAFFFLFFALGNVSVWAAADAAERSERIFGLDNFANAPLVAQAVDAQTPENSQILVWGSEAEIYFLSQRRPATRFLFNYPFTGEAPAWLGGEEEMLKAMEDPHTSAVVFQVGLEHSDPFQRRLGEILEKDYILRVDLAPEIMIGLRKR
jgi:hypothetical protein